MASFPHPSAPPTFGIPNDVVAGTNKQHRQSAFYSLDWDIVGRPNGFGVISGCQVTQRAAGANMSVDVAAGYVESEGVRLTVTATNVAVTTADATNPRIDVAVIDYLGVPRVRAGTAAAVPVPPALTVGDVPLAFVHLDATQASVVTADLIAHQANAITNLGSEPTLRGLQDFYLTHARQLQRYFRVLGDRLVRPTNVLLAPADSMGEGFGVTDDTQKWWWQLREAQQQQYRNGGVGFIPARHGVAWTYASNPDGKNYWTLVNLVDSVFYGFGLGDRTAFLGTTAASTATITVDCDVFYLLFTSGGGTATIDIDLGTAFAQSFTFSTASTGFGMSGRIYKSPTLPLGPHTIKVTSTTALGSVFLDGIMPFYADELVGAHFWDAAHSGYLSSHYDPTVTDSRGAGASTYWPEYAWQPTNETNFATGTGHGTTTFDATGAGFTANDVDEYLVGAQGASPSIPYGTKVVTFNSATQVVLNKVVANVGSLAFKINRAVFTDGVSNSTTTYTSALAQFTRWDENKKIKGTNIPTGTYIKRWNSATSIELSQAATGSAGTLTFQINNRSKYPVQPDMVVVEVGLNDMKYATTSASYKTSIKNAVQHIIDRGGLDFAPSVMLLGLWAPSLVYNWQDLGATGGAGQAVVTGLTGDYGYYNAAGTFVTDLVGLSVSGTNIPGGTTILSVQDPTHLTLSANISAGGLGAATFIVANRITQDFMWQRFRKAMAELAEEQGWFFKDLYTMYGYIGGGYGTAQVPAPIQASGLDPNNFTYDLIHSGNGGGRTIADQINRELGGTSKQGYLVQGLADAKGDSVWADGADSFKKLAAGQAGQGIHYAPNGAFGVRQVDDNHKARLVQQCVVTPAAIVTVQTGAIVAAPTITAGAVTTSVDDEVSARLSLNTSAVSANASKILSAFTLVRRGWMPEYTGIWKTGAAITSVRYWVGLFSADPSGSAAPAATSLAAFRYDTSVPDTVGFWAIATSNAGTQTVKATNVAITTATSYELAIVARGTAGSAPTAYDFYINDVLVGSMTANLPAAALILGKGGTVTTLTTAARSLEFSRDTLTCV